MTPSPSPPPGLPRPYSPAACGSRPVRVPEPEPTRLAAEISDEAKRAFGDLKAAFQTPRPSLRNIHHASGSKRRRAIKRSRWPALQ